MGKRNIQGPIVIVHAIWMLLLVVSALAWTPAPASAQSVRPDGAAGTLTVAVATFGNERWLPHLYVGAEDVVLKPLWENLLSRDAKGNLIPMLAERWQVLDGGTNVEVSPAQGRPLPQRHRSSPPRTSSSRSPRSPATARPTRWRRSSG